VPDILGVHHVTAIAGNPATANVTVQFPCWWSCFEFEHLS
jgi:hypothetical protein